MSGRTALACVTALFIVQCSVRDAHADPQQIAKFHQKVDSYILTAEQIGRAHECDLRPDSMFKSANAMFFNIIQADADNVWGTNNPNPERDQLIEDGQLEFVGAYDDAQAAPVPSQEWCDTVAASGILRVIDMASE